ncbi:biotin transporter BioY [Patescibacteria group bacterium]|nr:biotin transporter BioY [Patescibacteria group bacterium]
MKVLVQSKPVFLDVILPKSLIRNIVLVFSFAILTAISAKVKIEIGPVPITMQTFAVLFSGALLGSKRGFLSQATYLFLGLAGIPWFSRGGGIQYILSPTFGYILGFVFSAFLVGFLTEKGFDRNFKTAILAMLIGNIVIYLPGLLWLGKFIGFEKVLTIGLYPFLLGDLLKILLSAFLLPFGWKFITKRSKYVQSQR